MKSATRSNATAIHRTDRIAMFISIIILLFMIAQPMQAQLNGTYTVGTGMYFATISIAIDSLNAKGVSGPVVFDISAGHTETMVNKVINNTGAYQPTATNTVTFQKSGGGANPKLTSGTGIGTYDGILEMAGTDYVTIDGIDFVEDSAAHTTSTTRMEWAVGVFAKSTSDASQHIVIKNCNIWLKYQNTSIKGGIVIYNSYDPGGASITAASAAAAISYCDIYNNTITSSYNGVYAYGNATYLGTDNHIGSLGANTISAYGGGSTTTYGVYGIYQTGFKVENNTITGYGNTGTTYGIFMSTGVGCNVDFNGNNITIGSGAASSEVDGIKNQATGAVNIQNNTIQVTYPTATSGTVYIINQAAVTTSTVISGNTVQNCSLAGTGTIYGIYDGTYGSSTVSSIHDNIIDNITRTGASGAIQGIRYLYAGSLSVYNNTVSNLTIPSNSGSSASYVYAYYVSSTTSVTGPHNEYNNVAHDLSISGSSTSASSVIAGFFSNSAAATKNIYGNTVYNLSFTNSSTGVVTIYGVYVSSGGAASDYIYKNRVYNLSGAGTTSSVSGIYLNTALLGVIHNNMIHQLQAPNDTGSNSVCGIYLSGGTNDSVFYNTVYLDASSSSSTTFGSSAITSNVTSILNLRNNILVNASTPVGTSATVAYRRTGTTLTTYASTSDNNCFYAGTPGAHNLIFCDGTNSIQTLSDYKTFVSPRDVASFRELPPFVNISSAPYDIHLQPGASTQCESGGRQLSIQKDYDDDWRWGEASYAGTGTAPDVGADEGEFVASDMSAPSISYTVIPNSSSARPLDVAIVDASGVNTSSGTAPRIYFKKSTDANVFSGNTSGDNGWKWVETTSGSSPFRMTMDYSILYGGSAVIGDTIQYFVVAQDLSPAANLGAVPSNGFVGADVANITSAPASPNFYKVIGSLSGSYTIGVGGNYTTLTDALNDLNNGVVSCNVTSGGSGYSTAPTVSFSGGGGSGAAGYAVLTGDAVSSIVITEPGTGYTSVPTVTLTGSATATANIGPAKELAAPTTLLITSAYDPANEPSWPVVIYPVLNASSTNPLTIRPQSGSTVTSQRAYGGLFRLEGADYVVFDGAVSGSTKDWTIRNTSPGGYVFRFINGATNNILRNMVIESGNTVSSAAHIHISTSTVAGGNSSNLISQNLLKQRTDSAESSANTLPAYAIYASGTSSNLNSYNTISNNEIANFLSYGVNVSSTGTGNGWSISGNSFYNNLTSPPTTQQYVIYLTSTNNDNVIRGNYIGGSSANCGGSPWVNATSSSGFYGIYAYSGTGTGVTVDGNVIQNISFPNTSGSFYGLYFTSTNSGHLTVGDTTGNIIGSPSTPNSISMGGTGSLYGIYSTNSNATNVIRNNTIANMSITNTSSTGSLYGMRIYYADVRKNIIHSLGATASGASPTIYGIYHYGVSSTTNEFSNNMISLDGGSSANPSIYGFYDVTNTKIVKMYNNTILISGGATTSSFTYCFRRSVSSTDTLINNCFVNRRTIGGTGRHLAIVLNAPTNIMSDYNNFYCTDSAAVGSSDAAVTMLTMSQWQASVVQDYHSVSEDPAFVSSTNLHMNSGLATTLLESTGTTIAAVTDDIDGDTRPGPAGSVNGGAISYDIGYDEFDGVPAPVMTYASSTTAQPVTIPMPVGGTNGAIIRIDVTTDGYRYPLTATSFTLNTNGSTNPTGDFTNAKLWYTGSSSTFSASVQFGTTYSGPNGSFTITGSQGLMSGTNCFWLTYDVPSGATSGDLMDAECSSITIAGTPYTPAVTAPAGSRTIMGPLAGTKTVGSTGADFASLKEAFNFINAAGLAGNTTLSIITDLTEATMPVLHPWLETPAGSNYTLTIQPSGDRTITSSDTAVVKLFDADRVTIDGLNSGGNSLTLTNTGPAGPRAAVWLGGNGSGAGCDGVTVKNLVMHGNTTLMTSSSSYGIITGSGTGFSTGSKNDSLTIQGNKVGMTYYGIRVYGASSYTNNTVKILDNVVGNEDAAYGFQNKGMYLAYSTNMLISNNEVMGIRNSTTGQAGIYLSSGITNTTVEKNRIHSLEYNGTSGYGPRGIWAVPATTSGNVTIANNLIYDIIGDGDATITSSAACGIYLDGSSDSINVWYNSINLYGTQTNAGPTSGSPYITAAMFVNTNITKLNVRNNVLANSIKQVSGNYNNYAIYSAAAATAYNNINHNCYYAPDTTGRVGYLDGWKTTLADWRTATGKDAQSIAADPVYNSYENLIPNIGSPLASAGEPLSITVDYENNARNASTPYIGAYERIGDLTGPEIAYSPVSNTLSTSSPRIITDFASISDSPSGVDVTSNKPRLYYRKSTDANAFAGNTSTDNGWKWFETTSSGTPFSFAIDYAILYSASGPGSVAVGDSIYYFVVAQDLAASPNATAKQSTGFTGTSVGTITSAPTSPDMYRILPAISGLKTVGTGGTYATLTAAVDAINNSLITGPLELRLLDPLYSTAETFPLVINSNTTNASDTVLIHPASGVTATIQGTVESGALIKLNGIDHVTIDGSNSGTASRDLTIENLAATTTSAVVWIASPSATDGTTHTRVINNNIAGRHARISVAGIIGGSGTTFGSAAEKANSNTWIENNKFYRSQNGIYWSGVSTRDTGIVVRNNLFGASASTGDSLGFRGMALISVYDFEIYGNNMSTIGTSTTSTPSGVLISGDCINGSIRKNTIHYVINPHTTGYTVAGIYLGGSNTASNIEINNNAILDICGYGRSSTTGYNAYGIYVSTGGGYGIHNNTISFTTAANPTLATADPACIMVTSSIATAATLDVRNNIMANTVTVGTNVIGLLNNASTSVYSHCDYNEYYTPSANGAVGYTGSTAYSSLSTWITGSSLDSNSVYGDPILTSATDPHVIVGSGTDPIPAGSNKGVHLAEVTDDIDDVSRNATHPDVGCDEYDVIRSVTGTGPFTMPAGTVDNLTFNAAGQTMTLGGDFSRSIKNAFIQHKTSSSIDEYII